MELTMDFPQREKTINPTHDIKLFAGRGHKELAEEIASYLGTSVGPMIIKNFADRFYDKNYSTLGFPKHGKWIEVFNSDAKEYGGRGMTNIGKEFSNMNQNINLAANSIVVLKKISD